MEFKNYYIHIAIGVFLIVLFSVTSYWIYSRYYGETGTNNGFNANKEHTPKGGEEPTAELMFFYADWCPHCKVAKPEWEALVDENEGKSINNVKVIYTAQNCSELSPAMEEIVSKYDVNGYPTIKLVKPDGTVVDYEAKPTTSTLQQFLRQVL